MSQNTSETLHEERYDLLLVEDNAAHARLVTEMLRGTPCEKAVITHVTSLTEALETVSKHQFDLVLLDLGLPESRGVETFTRFHAAAPTQAVVVLTSLDDEHLALEMVKAGAEDYLPKEEMSTSLSRTILHAIERTHLNNRLLEREQQLRTILNSNLDGLIVVNKKGHTQYSNASGLKMLGADGVNRLMSHLQLTEELEKPTVISFDPDEGPTVIAEIRAARIAWDHHQSYLVSLRDITLRRQIENNLQQSQKMEMIGALSSGIAHDFNNILSAISGHAQLAELVIARGNDCCKETSDDITCILEAVNRGNFLVRDLMHLGRPQKIVKDQINLNDLLRKTEKLVAATIRRTHHLQFDIQALPCYISAAPENLEQVFINMIMNARDATEKNGKLSVEVCLRDKRESFTTMNGEAPAGKYACVIIKDTGSGINPETIPRIFEPFFTTKELNKGTGLGLFVASGIIRQHSGWIICETELGIGTTFTLYFPSTDPEDV